MFNFDSMKTEWFASWFDSPYYHTLYQNRNDEEAKLFISNLMSNLNLPLNSTILDLACGKGRHSVTLNELGYDVLGVDLSPNSIEKASVFSNSKLKFGVHDMRETINGERFDAILNLFTSFGYFDDMKDNERVIQSIHEMLNKKGILVIDFMNATKVINNLVLEEEKIVDDVHFKIKRSFDGQHIFKNIQFEADGNAYDFTERVQAIRLKEFEQLLKENQFQILRTFGDFNLTPFEESTADRLILIAQKK